MTLISVSCFTSDGRCYHLKQHTQMFLKNLFFTKRISCKYTTVTVLQSSLLTLRLVRVIHDLFASCCFKYEFAIIYTRSRTHGATHKRTEANTQTVKHTRKKARAYRDISPSPSLPRDSTHYQVLFTLYSGKRAIPKTQFPEH